MNPARRPLTFSSMDQVMPDVDRLLAGHRTVGQWSLGQILKHLSQSIICSVDGFPTRAPWLVRKTIGPLIVRNVLKTGRVMEGVKVPSIYIPKPDLDARAEAEALRAALRHLAAHVEPLAPHPMMDRISRADYDRFNLIHCAHHLSFAIPE